MHFKPATAPDLAWALLAQLLLYYFRVAADCDEECMLLLFQGVLCYVSSLTVEEVELQLLALPESMSPSQIRELLASTVWAGQDGVQLSEACFAKDFAYRAKLPCGSTLAVAMGRSVLQGPWGPVSRAEAVGSSLWAQWIFSIDPDDGSLRSRVEHEGFLLVHRKEFPCPSSLRPDAGDDDDESISHVSLEIERPRKRGRYCPALICNIIHN